MSSIVAIVGRPNVGKSTLFNRFTESREAIVDSVSGVTRDRHYGQTEWTGRSFTVIDTGGYVHGSDDVFESEINKQVSIAIDEADILLFVVDVTTGITDLDDRVADLLRRSKKPVYVVANKVDNNARRSDAHEFYGLGLGEVYCVAATSGSGTGELLDELVKDLPPDPEDEEEGLPRFAVVGRPNVGKSSLINALTGADRNIVTDISGTTRDSIDTHYNAYGMEFTLVDTAGLRKKGKVHENLEFYSVMRTIRSIESCDVCLLLIDAEDGVTTQDLNVMHLAVKHRKGVVILVNKWDLIEKDSSTINRFEEQILERIAPFTDVPIVFTSVTNKQRIHKALETAIMVYNNRQRRVKTSALNDAMLEEIEHNPPPAIKGKYIRIKYATQLPTKTPAFAFFCNLPQYIKDPYRRFIENKLREHFDFTGVPIQVYFRKK